MANARADADGYRAAAFAGVCAAREPAGEAGGASEAILTLERTSIMARCAKVHTGCAGHRALRLQDLPGERQTFRQIVPSMTSITSRIEAAAPLGVI